MAHAHSALCVPFTNFLMKTNTIKQSTETWLRRLSHAASTGLAVAAAAFLSYELTTRILTSAISSPHDQLLGGMWSAVATLVVYRDSYDESVGAALSRMSATSLSFVLCLVYLSFLPSNSWGMAILIALGAGLMIMINRPGDVITTSVTTAVVMIVAEVSPQHAWHQPILRLLDTLIGVTVGIAALWIGRGLQSRWPFRKSASSKRVVPTETRPQNV